ncbi:histone-lysine N-methyltransferase set1-like, partial [Thrips palmi]|uniref:Histone-lysine N-methyltransferase set1-like n=1 Tax=Thrips palmi TaxID=161013 RepID=A0A6P8YZI8_THRPL
MARRRQVPVRPTGDSRTLAEVKGDAIRQWVEQAAALALARSPKSINNNNNHIANNNELLKAGALGSLAGPLPKRQWSPTLPAPGVVPHLPSGPWSRASVSPPATVVPAPETPLPPRDAMMVAAPRCLDEQPLDFSVPEHVKKNGLKHVITNNNNHSPTTSPSYLRPGSSSASTSEDEGVGNNTESSAVESSPMAPRADEVDPESPLYKPNDKLWLAGDALRWHIPEDHHHHHHHHRDHGEQQELQAAAALRARIALSHDRLTNGDAASDDEDRSVGGSDVADDVLHLGHDDDSRDSNRRTDGDSPAVTRGPGQPSRPSTSPSSGISSHVTSSAGASLGGSPATGAPTPNLSAIAALQAGQLSQMMGLNPQSQHLLLQSQLASAAGAAGLPASLAGLAPQEL